MRHYRSLAHLEALISPYHANKFEDEWRLALIERLDALIETLELEKTNDIGPGTISRRPMTPDWDADRDRPYSRIPKRIEESRSQSAQGE